MPPRAHMETQLGASLSCSFPGCPGIAGNRADKQAGIEMGAMMGEAQELTAETALEQHRPKLGSLPGSPWDDF